jgi:hypothetical protein
MLETSKNIKIPLLLLLFRKKGRQTLPNIYRKIFVPIFNAVLFTFLIPLIIATDMPKIRFIRII